MIEFTSESPKPNPSGFVVSMAAVIRLKLLSSSGGPLSTLKVVERPHETLLGVGLLN